ncbi:MAG: hypothetical protein FWG64_04490, partial [Firmicutes bacterium]|nr:hypothetical protein [Bacillota bacterium]
MDFRCFGFSVFRIFGVSYFRCFGFSMFRIFGVSDFRRFGFSVFRRGGYYPPASHNGRIISAPTLMLLPNCDLLPNYDL